MNCQQFRQRLAEQKVKYRSVDYKYPGDEQFQSYTKLRKNRREKSNTIDTEKGSSAIWLP